MNLNPFLMIQNCSFSKAVQPWPVKAINLQLRELSFRLSDSDDAMIHADLIPFRQVALSGTALDLWH